MTQYNETLPTGQMNNDILSLVYKQLFPDEWGNIIHKELVLDRPPYWGQVAQVCTQWCYAVPNLTCIWSKIMVPSSAKVFSQWLAWSQQVPLVLCVQEAPCDVINLNCMHLIDHASACLRCLSVHSPQSSLYAPLSLWVQAVPVLKSLVLAVSDFTYKSNNILPMSLFSGGTLSVITLVLDEVYVD